MESSNLPATVLVLPLLWARSCTLRHPQQPLNPAGALTVTELCVAQLVLCTKAQTYTAVQPFDQASHLVFS